MDKFLIINGPNLNMLGKREPEVYGSTTLPDVISYTEKKLGNAKLKLDWFQSNVEGEIVSKIQELAAGGYKGLIINPGGYSHTSVAIHDALKILTIPILEVHLSNVHAREDFRQTLLTAKAAKGIMSGLGKDVYYLAALFLAGQKD